MAKFKKTRVFTQQQKEDFARRYYKSHQAAVDKAAEAYKAKKIKLGEMNPDVQVSNEKIFSDLFVLGEKGWYSAKTAGKAASKILYEMSGKNMEWYEAYHEYWNTNQYPKYNDLRKFNNKKANYIDYEFGNEADEEGKVLGYFDFGDPALIIAKVFYKPTDSSPVEVWEMRSKIDIGVI